MTFCILVRPVFGALKRSQGTVEEGGPAKVETLSTLKDHETVDSGWFDATTFGFLV